jgi:hypothetical protein
MYSEEGKKRYFIFEHFEKHTIFKPLHSKKVCVRKRSQGFCVVRTQTFVLDDLKNTLIDTSLCGISAFCVENSKISHKFVFKLTNTNLCSDNTKSL